MKLDQVRPVFDAEGPFTTVRCDVSRHTEHSAHDIQVRWESLVKALDAIYKVFVETDASMIEINPLILTKGGDLLALDAKVTFDDSAL